MAILAPRSSAPQASFLCIFHFFLATATDRRAASAYFIQIYLWCCYIQIYMYLSRKIWLFYMKIYEKCYNKCAYREYIIIIYRSRWIEVWQVCVVSCTMRMIFRYHKYRQISLYQNECTAFFELWAHFSTESESMWAGSASLRAVSSIPTADEPPCPSCMLVLCIK